MFSLKSLELVQENHDGNLDIMTHVSYYSIIDKGTHYFIVGLVQRIPEAILYFKGFFLKKRGVSTKIWELLNPNLAVSECVLTGRNEILSFRCFKQ